MADAVSFDFTGSAGYGHTEVAATDQAPTLGEFALAASAKYNLASWFAAGLVTEYQAYNQYSDPTVTVGNRTGWRWTVIEPMLELHSADFSLKASYSFLGNYHLPDTTFAGFSDLAYESPKGTKVALLMRIADKSPVWAGIYYGQVKYSWANFTANPLPLQTWQAGVSIELRLLEDGSSKF